MNIDRIIALLQNSGLKNVRLVDDAIKFDDPSCIYRAFDNILNFGWIVIVILTGIMLLGWAILYIKNGMKINSLFNNAKSVILVFCILSAVKPIINTIYGEDLFAKNCAEKSVSLATVQELYEMRNKNLSQSEEDELYEIFDIIDSGPANEAEH